MGTWSLFPGGIAAGALSRACISPIAEVKNEWSYTVLPLQGTTPLSFILIQIKWNCCGLWMQENMKNDFTSIPNSCITHFDRQKKRGLTTEKMETPTPMNNMSRIVAADETWRSIQPF